MRLTIAMHDLCRAFLSLVSLPSEYEYCRIDGNTPHDTRQDLIEEYNAPVRPLAAATHPVYAFLPDGSTYFVQDEKLHVG